MVQSGRGTSQRGEHLGDLTRIRPRRGHLDLSLGDTRGGDELHRLGDFADRSSRLDPGTEFAKLCGHELSAHFLGAGLLTLTVSCPTLSESIASASAPVITLLPSVVVKSFLNSSTASAKALALSSENLPESRISVKISSCLR